VTGNPLVAEAHNSTTWYTGLGLVEDAAQISSGIHDNSWVDGTLGGVGGSLDVLGMVIDPLGSLMAWGVSWLMEHVQPLKEALDWLAGNPDEIAAHAATWRNVSAATTGTHQQLADAVRTQTTGWSGESGDAYRGHATPQLEALGGRRRPKPSRRRRPRTRLPRRLCGQADRRARRKHAPTRHSQGARRHSRGREITCGQVNTVLAEAAGADTNASIRLDRSDDGNHAVASTRERDHCGGAISSSAARCSATAASNTSHRSSPIDRGSSHGSDGRCSTGAHRYSSN